MRVAQRDAVGGSRRLVDFSVRVERCEADIAIVKGLCNEIKKGYFSVIGPNEWVFDQEQSNHGDDRPQSNGFQRITSMFNRSRTDIRRDVQHLQCRLKAGEWKWVFDQPHTSEDDEVHDTEETCKH